MTDLLSRKTRLIVETAHTERGRAVIAEVKPWGLVLRQKGRRTRTEITWGAVWWRAQQIAADKLRDEMKAARKGKRCFTKSGN